MVEDEKTIQNLATQDADWMLNEIELAYLEPFSRRNLQNVQKFIANNALDAKLAIMPRDRKLPKWFLEWDSMEEDFEAIMHAIELIIDAVETEVDWSEFAIAGFGLLYDELREDSPLMEVLHFSHSLSQGSSTLAHIFNLVDFTVLSSMSKRDQKHYLIDLLLHDVGKAFITFWNNDGFSVAKDANHYHPIVTAMFILQFSQYPEVVANFRGENINFKVIAEVARLHHLGEVMDMGRIDPEMIAPHLSANHNIEQVLRLLSVLTIADGSSIKGYERFVGVNIQKLLMLGELIDAMNSSSRFSELQQDQIAVWLIKMLNEFLYRFDEVKIEPYIEQLFSDLGIFAKEIFRLIIDAQNNRSSTIRPKSHIQPSIISVYNANTQ